MNAPRKKLNIADTDLDPDRIPAHIAIIMDGNGTWAKARGLRRREGHFQGYLALKDTVYGADDLDVKFLTVYGFSSENWRRPEEEVVGLMDLMATAMLAELDELMENDIRVRVQGRLAEIPEHTRQAFAEAEARTAGNSRLTFTLAINYGGRVEIVDAVRKLGDDVVKGIISPGEINEDAIASKLYRPDHPDPDLMIRTGGHSRISNFLLWESAYSEFYLTPTLWPDFGAATLVEAIGDYQARTRKFGGIVENE